MKKRLLQVLAIVCGALLSAASFAQDPAEDTHTARHEAGFLHHTIDHHEQAIRMAESCTQNAVNPDLLAFCTTLLEAHQAETDQLMTWLDEWYDEDHEARLAPATQARIDQLATFTEGEFERNFLMDMIPHHAQGIAELAKCQAQFEHEELISLCETSITTQAAEITQMRSLLCELQGICSLEVREVFISARPYDTETAFDIDDAADDGSGTDDGMDGGTDGGTDDGSGDGTDDGSGDGTDDGSGDGTDDGSGDGTDDGSDGSGDGMGG